MVETDVRYYRRRACEEMGAANRAVTEAARERRLQLVDLYLQRLAALKAPNPFDEHDFARVGGPAAAAKPAPPSTGRVRSPTRESRRGLNEKGPPMKRAACPGS